jgi:hypothetical protein
MIKLDKLLWLVRRAAAMSPRELIYRAAQKIDQLLLGKQVAQAISLLSYAEDQMRTLSPSRITRFAAVWDFRHPSCEHNPYRYRIFTRKVDLTAPVSWHGFEDDQWDPLAFSWKIDTKNQDSKGELREVWELNRMQFMPYIALYAVSRNDEGVYARMKELFYDWMEQNPFLCGVNWLSPMEIAIRAYQWTAVCAILAAYGKDAEFQVDLLSAAVQSVGFVMGHLSAFSSANNHLIVEAALCGIIGLLIEETHPQPWYRQCRSILEREFSRQFYEDGVNREHAVHYHAFVVDAWLQFSLVSVHCGFEPIMPELLGKAVQFLHNLQIGDCAVEFGDSDDAHILSFAWDSSSYQKEILAMSRLCSGEDSSPAGVWQSSAWLPLPRNVDPYTWYEKSGYFIYNDGTWLFLFDAAELGFGKLAAHGHADALQILLYHRDEPILIDSGTYVYNVDQPSRNYFRSTAAHNTVSLCGKSQSQISGPFLWGKKAAITQRSFERTPDGVIITAAHDGYAPHRHERTVRLLFRNGFLNQICIHDVVDIRSCAHFHWDPSYYENGEATYRFIQFSAPAKKVFCFHSPHFLERDKHAAFQIDFSDKLDTTIDIDNFLPCNYGGADLL